MKNFLSNFEKYTAFFLFLILASLMIVNVFMRFVLNNSLSWASEMVLTLFVWFVWLSISYAFKENAHIRVTVIVSLLPKKGRVIVNYFVSITMILFFAVLLKSGIDLLGHYSVTGKTSLLLRYPMWVFYLSSIFGIFLSIIRISQNLIKDIKGGKCNG